MKILLFFLIIHFSINCFAQDTLRWVKTTSNQSIRKSNNPYLESNLGNSLEDKTYIIVENWKDTLLVQRKETFNETCLIGTTKGFYENGDLKFIHNYQLKKYDKKIDSLCNRLDGQLIEFSLNGDTVRNEIWEEGSFHHEILIQDSSTIWKSDLKINDINTQEIISTNNHKLELQLIFRENNRPKIRYSINVFYIRGRKLSELKFKSVNNFNNYNFKNWFNKQNIINGDRILIEVSDNNKTLFYYNLFVK